MSYAERQKEWVEKNDVKVGDKVVVLRKARDEEGEWGNAWVGEMDLSVGEEIEIVDIDDYSGVDCMLPYEDDDTYGFPFFCLEKVVEEDKKEEETEKQPLINGVFYHITCHGEGNREWIIRCDNSTGDRGYCDGSLRIEGGEFWGGLGLCADEDQIKELRFANEDEIQLFLNAEYGYKAKERRKEYREQEFYEEHEDSSFSFNEPKNKYSREVYPNIYIDVYDVLRAFEVKDGALAHLIKKALADGQRGHKDRMQDRIDILDSAKCAIRNLEIENKIEEDN